MRDDAAIANTTPETSDVITLPELLRAMRETREAMNRMLAAYREARLEIEGLLAAYEKYRSQLP